MPELPEVETIKRRLIKEIVNRRIKKIVIKDSRLIKGIPPKIFKKRVEGKKIQDISRRGKVLIIKLDKSLFLIFHLRISGWIIVGRGEERFSRLAFFLSDNKILHFCDQRVLGEIKLIDDWRKLPLIKRMGPELFDINKEAFVALFKERTTRVHPLLMNQEFIAGVGNIYAQEVLFLAGLHPGRKVSSLTKGELEKIYCFLNFVLKAAIRKKGSSVDTYRQVDGHEGSYVSCLTVYQRQKQPCVKCKTPIKRMVISGRGVCFCPRCQK
ncbi:MAG: bifunctional DNA-formamidopyrimidine glycosylase/DNA-(apurinic or apyrimidinic site) lyase [Candidatus Omnitrophota bacterium]